MPKKSRAEFLKSLNAATVILRPGGIKEKPEEVFEKFNLPYSETSPIINAINVAIRCANDPLHVMAAVEVAWEHYIGIPA